MSATSEPYLIGRRARPGAATLAIAAVFAIAVLAPGVRAPFQKDAEPQSAEWIVSVLRDGRWLIPRDYYGFVDRKPPLYYWLSAAATKLSGGIVDEAHARVISLLAGSALAIEILAWTAANVGEADGWLAFLFLLGTYGFAARADLALTDMLMTLCVVSALMLIYPLLSPMLLPMPERRCSSRRAVLAGIVVGLGILTKGPVAMILVALAAVIFLAIERRNPFAMLKQAWPWQLAAVAIAIAACWYVPWLLSGGPRVVEIFLAENFGHFLPARYGGTGEASRPVWFIVARLAGGTLPIVALIPAALAALATGAIGGARRTPIVFQASLTLAVIAFFSIASAKRDDYILPAIPGIAILCASVFTLDTTTTARMRPAARLRDVAVAAVAIITIAAIGLASLPTQWLAPRLQSSDAALLAVFASTLESRAAWPLFFVIAMAIAAVAALVAMHRRRTFAAAIMFAILALAGSLLFNATLQPRLAAMRSLKTFAAQVHQGIDAAPIFLVHDANFEFAYYYGYGVPPLTGKLAGTPPTDRTFYVMAYDHELPKIAPELRARMNLILRADVIGGDGPPVLYEVAPAGHPPGLKAPAPGTK